jgi:hypothetical protein
LLRAAAEVSLPPVHIPALGAATEVQVLILAGTIPAVVVVVLVAILALEGLVLLQMVIGPANLVQVVVVVVAPLPATAAVNRVGV